MPPVGGGGGGTAALTPLFSATGADMNIFGHCPAHDEFYLVVCNHCSQVVKPQAFQKHCGERGPGGPGTGERDGTIPHHRHPPPVSVQPPR